MAEVLFRAKLSREADNNTPWGFRLQGGVEFDKPLTLLKVFPESLAAKGGLHPGDIVVKLAGKSAEDMTHKDAQEAIISAGNALEIIVERAEVTLTSPTYESDDSGEESSEEKSHQCPPSSSTSTPATGTETTSSSSASSSTSNSSSSSVENKSNAEDAAKQLEPAAQPKQIDPEGELCSKGDVAKDSTASENDVQGSTSSKGVPDTRTPDNNIKTSKHELQKGIEGSSNAKHKPPDNNNVESDKMAIVTSSGGLENERKVNVKAAPEICDKATVAEEETTETEVPAGSDKDESEISSSESTLKNNVKEGDAKTSNSVKDTLKMNAKEEAKPSTQDNCDSKDLSDLSNHKPALSNDADISSDGSVQDALPSSKLKPKVPPNSIIDKSGAIMVNNDGTSHSKDNMQDDVTEKLKGTKSSASPSVINEFQTNNAEETFSSPSSTPSISTSTSSTPSVNAQPRLDTTTKDDISNVANVGQTVQLGSESQELPEGLTSIGVADETTQKLNIPQSSSSLIPSGKVSPTVAIVIEEVPKETITATSISPAPKEKKEGPVKQPSPITVSKSPTKVKSTVSTQGEKPVTFTPITIKNQRGEALAQTVLKSPSQPSRQTQAPAEEILIAPKPSVQIMSTHENKESAKVPSGEHIKGDVASPETIESKDESKAPVAHEMKDFSKTAPWRVHKQSGSSPQQIPTTQPVQEAAALHPWRKSRTEHAMSNSLDERQLTDAAVRLKETPTLAQQMRQTPGIATIPEISQRTKSELDLPATKLQPSLTYVGKRIESPPVVSPSGTGSPFFKANPVSTNPPAAQPPGFKARQPSPTNPLAYQRSVSPQGHLQYGPARGSSPIQYQQVPVPPSNVTLQQSASPRNSSPVSFQQPVRLQPNVGYNRSPSPQGNVALPMPQSGQYQPPSQVVLTPKPQGPRMAAPQQIMQPPGYSHQPHFPVGNPRLPGSLQAAGYPVPRGPPGPQMVLRRPAMSRDVPLRLPEGAAMAVPPIAGINPALLAGALGQPQPSEEMSQGVFAYFDKKFTDKFLQWSDDRSDGLYESETYKLVHELDEQNDDL